MRNGLELYQAYTDVLLDEQFVINLVVTDFVTIYSGLTWNLYKYLIANSATVSTTQ